MGCTDIMTIINIIALAIDKLGLLDGKCKSSNVTHISDEVIENIHTITNGLRDCIAHLDDGLSKSNQWSNREEIQPIKERIVSILKKLQSSHTILANSYVEGGDNRDQAHLTMLELKTLVTGIGSIRF